MLPSTLSTARLIVREGEGEGEIEGEREREGVRERERGKGGEWRAEKEED